jgi:hypothetical protein
VKEHRNELCLQIRILDIFRIGQEGNAESVDLFAESCSHNIWRESIEN